VNDLESLECIHICIQGTGSHPTIQGHGQAGRISRSPVLTLVLARGAVSTGPPFPISNSTLLRRSAEFRPGSTSRPEPDGFPLRTCISILYAGVSNHSELEHDMALIGKRTEYDILLDFPHNQGAGQVESGASRKEMHLR
jgi:hypothetical protein